MDSKLLPDVVYSEMRYRDSIFIVTNACFPLVFSFFCCQRWGPPKSDDIRRKADIFNVTDLFFFFEIRENLALWRDACKGQLQACDDDQNLWSCEPWVWILTHCLFRIITKRLGDKDLYKGAPPWILVYSLLAPPIKVVPDSQLISFKHSYCSSYDWKHTLYVSYRIIQ